MEIKDLIHNKAIAGIDTPSKEEALKVLEKMNFPTTKDEEWKYTNLKRLVKNEFEFSESNKISEDSVSTALIPGLEAELLVFVNGNFNEALSNFTSTDKVEVKTLKSAFNENADILAKNFSKNLNFKEDVFLAASTASSCDGAFVHIKKSAVAEKPILFLNIIDANGKNIASAPRNFIYAAENSEAQIIEITKTVGNDLSFFNAVTEIYTEKHSRIKHTYIQNDKVNATLINNTQVVQAGESHFEANTFSIGAGLVRNNLHIILAGEHSETLMNGIYALDGEAHVDNHTTVDHTKANCLSDEMYKGVMDGKSTGVFNGKVFVRQDAQKTNAFQSNKNILLSDDATVNTKPQLEIWADDVKCSHGATTGQMNEEALFYLQARGINKKKAQALLLKAFAGEVLERSHNETIASYIEGLIDQKLEVQ